MANNLKPSIIIKKIKKSSPGHHGGAWKVAYADFVTAMMAFFLLLWLLSTQPTKKLLGIANYFTPTIGLRDQQGIGFEAGTTANDKDTSKHTKGNDAIIYGSEYKGTVVKVPETALKNLEKIDAKNFSSIAHDLYKAVHDNPETQNMQNSIKIDETPEGLRIQLLDQDKRPMFIPGTYDLQPYTKTILKLIAKFIRFMPNYVAVSGHTSKDKIPNPNSLDNWELSAKRANVARKFLVDEASIDTEQIERIIGKADQEPLDEAHPDSPNNIRISLMLMRNTIVPFQKQAAPDSALFDKKDSSSADGSTATPDSTDTTAAVDTASPQPAGDTASPQPSGDTASPQSSDTPDSSAASLDPNATAPSPLKGN
jgi:chemotaxis protein MotB